MADRREVALAIAAGLARGDFDGLSKAEIYHQFEDRGVSRAGVYRAIEDALAIVAKQGIAHSKIPSPANAPPMEGTLFSAGAFAAPPKASRSPDAAEMAIPVTLIELGPLTAAFTRLEQAVAQLREGTVLPATIANVGQAIEGLRASTGGGGDVEQFIAAVVGGMQRGGPAFGDRMAGIFGRIGR
jgi:hypothetical protein